METEVAGLCTDGMRYCGTPTHVDVKQLNVSVKEPNKFHVYETEKITCKASDVAEYIELFSSFT